MTKTLVLKESDISKLLKQYSQEDILQHPEEITYARELIYEGEWEWVEDLLHPFTNQVGYLDLLYCIRKQAYLELLHQNNDSSISRLMSLMKKINESEKSHYNSLLLVKSHDPSRIRLLRHALFIQVAKFMYKYMYPSMSWEAPPTPDASRLTQLITRGLLYEKCEKAYTGRKNDTQDVINLVGWFRKSIATEGRTSLPTLSIDIISDDKPHNPSTPPVSSQGGSPPPHGGQVSLTKSAPSKVLPHMVAPFTTPVRPDSSPSDLPRTSTPRIPAGNEADTTEVPTKSTVANNELTLTPIRIKQDPPKSKALLLSTIQDKQAIRSISFTNDGGLLAVGSNSRTIKIFDTRRCSNSKAISLNEVYSQADYHLGSIYCLSWNASNSLLASGSNDRMINLLYRVQGSSRYESCGVIKNPGGVVRELNFDDDHLVSVGAGGVRVMNSERLTVTYQSSTSDHTYCICPIEPKILVTGDEKGCVTVWDTRQPAPAYIHRNDHVNNITSIDHHNGGISYSTNTGTCYTLQYNNLNAGPLMNWSPHGNTECRSLRYSLDGKWILTGSYDSTVTVTETDTLRCTMVCQHNDKVIQARWCPTQQYYSSSHSVIATSSADKTTKLWRLTL